MSRGVIEHKYTAIPLFQSLCNYLQGLEDITFFFLSSRIFAQFNEIILHQVQEKTL